MLIDEQLHNEHLTRVIKHNLDFRGSYKSMEAVAKIVNQTPDASIKIPSTIYKMKKNKQPIFTTEIQMKCSGCFNYTSSQKNSTICRDCFLPIKTTDSDYFVYIPILQQLEESIKSNIDEILEYHSKVLSKNEITDIHSADIFQRAQRNYPDHIILILVVNTDGAKVYKSTTESLWLIQLYMGYLPPQKRFLSTNIAIVAAHVGSKKPNMKDFFYPFLRDLREINESNGIHISHNEKTYRFMPLILCACCDLPAKADLQGMVGHSGRFGCGFCFHPGEPVKSQNNNKSVIRFLKGCYELRTHANTIATYDKLNQKKSINGVKGISCMVAAKEFDLINGFGIDHMHCAELFMKKLLNLWLDTKNHSKPYYIKKKHQEYLNQRVMSQKPVSEIIRRPRSIFSRGDFKANEMRGLILFFLRFALPGLLPNIYVKHFVLFSSALYALLKESISIDDINQANEKLNEFVDAFEELYGQDNVTMNLHLLRHLPLAVKNLGPLWAQSAYGFESNNGVVVKSNTCTRDMVHQVAWKYIMKQTTKENNQNNELKKNSIGGKKYYVLNSAEMLLLQQEGMEIQDEEKITIYTNIEMRGLRFKSAQSKIVATIDYFVKFHNDNFGAICFFLIFNSILYAVVDTYEIVDTFDHFIQIKKFTKQMIPASSISKKMIYLKYGQREFLTSFPNVFEKT